MAEPARFTTILDDLDVTMGIGVHAHEQAAPQRVRLSVRLTIDYPEPPRCDRIEEVLDYDFLRSGVHDLVANRHFALQETLCEAVARLCLDDLRVIEVQVRSTKLDVYPDARIGCEIVRRR